MSSTAKGEWNARAAAGNVRIDRDTVSARPGTERRMLDMTTSVKSRLVRVERKEDWGFTENIEGRYMYPDIYVGTLGVAEFNSFYNAKHPN